MAGDEPCLKFKRHAGILGHPNCSDKRGHAFHAILMRCVNAMRQSCRCPILARMLLCLVAIEADGIPN
jgi:hypothetical protein